MNRIYLCGKMRGVPCFNFPAFDAIRDRLIAVGWDVISPADLDRAVGFDAMMLPADYDWKNVPASFDKRACIRRDLDAIQTCDAIYMLKCREYGTGSMAELAVARWLGLEVYYESEWLPKPENDLYKPLQAPKG